MIYIFIFILTLSDVSLTAYGVLNGQISEGNPLMAKILDYNLIGGAMVVLLVTGLLIWFLSKQKFKWLKYACLGLLTIKIGVMFMHMNWLIK